MATTPKQVNCDSNNNGSSGKRKKSRGNKGSYLSKWLDKTMHHIQESTPSMDNYDSYVNSSVNWQLGSSQFAPGYDPYRHIYGCATEPMSLPTLPSYCNPPLMPLYAPDYRYVSNTNKIIQVQRPRQNRRCDTKPEEMQNTPHLPNKSNYLQPKNFCDSQDFASLPPIVTSVVDTNSNSDMNTNDKDDASNNRRYSDPCVRGLPDVARPANGDVDSGSEASSELSGSQVGSRLLSCLLDQITTLKLANERLNKDLLDTKVELENLRQHNIILQKGSSSSIGATPNHTSFNDNGLLGGQYGPGFLSDLVREIRDAARMREEALYSRVRAMIIERTNNGMAASEAKFTEKTLDEIKSSLRASEVDKRLIMDRIVKLEEDFRQLRIVNGLELNDKVNGNVDDSESEKVHLRKEVAEMRKAKQNAEEHAHKLERLVTQLRSKFNGLHLMNGPESLPSDAEHESGARARRTSVNSTNNSTVVFGPVTDL